MRPLWIAGLVTALVGTAIAGYLTAVRLSGSEIACAGGGGCESVQASRYGFMLGVPLPYLGLAFYLTVTALMAAGLRAERAVDIVLPVLLLLTLAGAIFSGYLTGIQAAVLGQFCMWCLGSAFVETTLLALSAALLWVRSHEVA